MCVQRLIVFALALLLTIGFAQDRRADIRALKNGTMVHEKADGQRITVRLWSRTLPNNLLLAQRCIAAYRQVYGVVLCFVYDNPRALDSDLRPNTPGGTLTCWRHSAALVSSGKLSTDEMAPSLLENMKCPRP
jgi:hypothetical protein